MPTIKKNISLPGDYIIDKIFKEYGSADFYLKFRKGGYAFTPEITKEWRDNYMNGAGVVHQEDFFVKLYSWESGWNKKMKDNPMCPIGLSYHTVIAHILPVCAPIFFEQESSLTNAEKESALITTNTSSNEKN